MAHPLVGNTIKRLSLIFIGKANGISNAPQNINFELQYIERMFLLLSGNKVVKGNLQAMLYITARLTQPHLKVGKAFTINPCIVPRPGI